MTFKRDYCFIYILSKLLEEKGCECIIVNNTNLHKKYFRLWKPHAVFFVTLSHARSIRSSYPNAKLFLWAAEGGYEDESEELAILDNPELISSIDKIYLWGEATLKAMENKMGKLNFTEDRKKTVKEKCVIAGNPRMDIAKFHTQRLLEKTKKTNIGLIGNFYYINNKNYHPFSVMLDSELSKKGSMGKLDEIQFQIRQLKTYCDLMRELGTDDYSFSFRPYPLENIENYKTLTHTEKLPFEISDLLDFSIWIARQDLIIGATSTTISQIAAAKKPYINIDKLNKRPSRHYDMEMSKGLKKHQPASYTEMMQMVRDYEKYKLDNPTIQGKLDYYHNASGTGSAIRAVAKDIEGQLTNSHDTKSLLNKSAACFLDDLWSSYIEKRSAEELKNNYSYFRRSQVESEIAHLLPLTINIQT